MDNYLQANRNKWNSVTPIHAKSEYYGVDKFKQGKCTLQDLERQEVGDVTGKSLLHLQCHFGLDTMSWARLGAKVSGVDFSGEAITLAKSLANELNIPDAKIIKLDGNENPYDPFPEVIKALSSLKNISHYPDTLSSNLIDVLAKKENLDVNNFIISSGSDELIELLIRAYANPTDSILSFSPTFGMISFLAQVHGIRYMVVPQQLVKKQSIVRYILDENQFLDNAKQAKIVFISRPNNPDGSVVSEKFIERLISLPILVIIDEAYIEFSDYPSLAKIVLQNENLVILRTFSKAYGLGGLRVGYGILPNDIRKVLVSIKQPYNVNIAGQIAAVAALSSPLIEPRIKEMKETREWFINQLRLIQSQYQNFLGPS